MYPDFWILKLILPMMIIVIEVVAEFRIGQYYKFEVTKIILTIVLEVIVTKIIARSDSDATSNPAFCLDRKAVDEI